MKIFKKLNIFYRNGGSRFGPESSDTATAPLPEHLIFKNVDKVESHITTAHNNLRKYENSP